jgi:hypothetical protein
MNLVASTAQSVPACSVSIWRCIPTIVTVRMKTVAPGAALSAAAPGSQEKQHGSSEQQNKNAHSDQCRAVHMLRPPSLAPLWYH